MRQRSMGLRKAVLALALILMPCAASAGLTGDTITATLTDVDTSTVIFTGSAIVLDPGGPEFAGTFGLFSSWSLDMLDNGFELSAGCTASFENCEFPAGLTLALSGLDFTPPANLLGLATFSSDELIVVGSPVVTPSSITITFDSYTLGSTTPPQIVVFEATFQTEPRADPGVPLPGTLLLVSAGLGLAALALRRPRA
ncbi:MAG TPA: hypothetical protein VML54_02985 [Candidatus Limnocylindrales bacterium]|nr:hypothetical protein [Candidatus Limnocylindrales bacterium]